MRFVLSINFIFLDEVGPRTVLCSLRLQAQAYIGQKPELTSSCILFR